MPYRAWAIMVTNDPDIFLEVVERTLREAPRYHINRIEFHDFVFGSPSPEGFVENVVRYEAFERLKETREWRFLSDSVWLKDDKPPVSNERMDRNVEVFRKAARMVKAAGLKLNVWYHSFREVPLELVEAYPDLMNPDSDFLFEASARILDEFFRKVPEVDGLTLTSLAETRSLAELPGKAERKEKMQRFYQTAYDVCARHGRELILRDFGGEDDFWEVAEALPREITFMTKWMPSDWERVHHPLNRKLKLAEPFKFVVEWDLRGEYLGEGFFPYVNPRHFWVNFHNVKLFNPHGCVGRVHWTDWKGKQYEWDSVFDSPNGLNAHVFSRALCSTSRHRVTEIPAGVQAELLPFGWIQDWIVEHYGPEAWPGLWLIFNETPWMVESLCLSADRYHSNHSFPQLLPFEAPMKNVQAMLEEAGRAYIDADKRRVAERAVALREEVGALPGLSDTSKAKLERIFKVMAAFAHLHRISVLLLADLQLSLASAETSVDARIRLVDSACEAMRSIARELGGGMARMVEERLDRDAPQLLEWVRGNGTSAMKR